MKSTIAATIMRLAARSDIKAKAKDLEPGQHQVDEEIRIRALLKKGEDYESVVSQSIPWKQIATALLNRVNRATVDAILGAVVRGEEDTKALKPEVEEALEILRRRTVQTCAGKLTGQADLITQEVRS